MSTLETRRINQSTYTPIVNSKDVGDDIPGFVPEQPFLKQSLLTIAFDDPTYCQFLLENTEGISEPLKAAAEEMWKGDYAAVATLLNGVKLDEIAASIRKVLDEEKKLIDDARQNLEKSVSAVVEEEHVESVVTDIENFLDQAEDSIVSLVQENTTVVQNVHQAFTDARNEIIALIERHGTGKQTVDQVKTIIDLSRWSKEIRN